MSAVGKNEKEKQGLCNVYKNIPCFFVYRVKNVIGQLTNRWNRNIIINMERVPSKIENIMPRER